VRRCTACEVQLNLMVIQDVEKPPRLVLPQLQIGEEMSSTSIPCTPSLSSCDYCMPSSASQFIAPMDSQIVIMSLSDLRSHTNTRLDGEAFLDFTSQARGSLQYMWDRGCHFHPTKMITTILMSDSFNYHIPLSCHTSNQGSRHGSNNAQFVGTSYKHKMSIYLYDSETCIRDDPILTTTVQYTEHRTQHFQIQ